MKRPKPRVIFVFGIHGDKTPNGDIPAHTDFFRNAIVPLVEDEIRAGRKVALIRELGIAKSFLFEGAEKSALLLEGKMQDADMIAGRIYHSVRRFMAVSNSIIQRANTAEEIDFQPPEWGYEEIVKFNQTKLLRIVHEQVTLYCVTRGLRHWIAQNCKTDLPDLDSNTLRMSLLADYSYCRDRCVYFQAAQLVGGRYQTIIIPRGLLHLPMTTFFKEEKYEKGIIAEDYQSMGEMGAAISLYMELMCARYEIDHSLDSEFVLELAKREKLL